jgi:plasmid stabilization system protein ParE
VRVAQGWEKGTIVTYMVSAGENCLHLGGLRIVAGLEYLCPLCRETLDLEGVARWVRRAERARDEAYSLVEGDEFGEIAREELQREVYRRRRVMYDLQSVPRVMTARPEMILVVHDARSGSYECRIFYKEPRPVGVVEQLSVEAGWETILELRTDPNPVVRLASEKVEEFHLFRRGLSNRGAPAPGRRVFYTNEF